MTAALSPTERRSLDWRNRSMLSAYWRGVRAFRDGVPRARCPYRDAMGHRGTVTWTTAFANAWLDGWDTAEAEERER